MKRWNVIYILGFDNKIPIERTEAFDYEPQQNDINEVGERLMEEYAADMFCAVGCECIET